MARTKANNQGYGTFLRLMHSRSGDKLLRIRVEHLLQNQLLYLPLCPKHLGCYTGTPKVGDRGDAFEKRFWLTARDKFILIVVYGDSGLWPVPCLWGFRSNGAVFGHDKRQ